MTLIHVQAVEEPVRDRSDENSDGREERDAREERIERREELGRGRRQRIHRSHPAENH